MRNYGLNLKLEQEHRSHEDWKFGAFSLPCLASIPEEERQKYLPVGETQRGAEDTMDCASRGPVNILETKFTYLLQTKKLKNEQWLRDKGYVVNERVTFSDAFVAINSGTTRQGNSLKAPLEAIRKHGLIPKQLMPLEPWMTWEDYHNPARITEDLKNLGAEFIRRFTINYEYVLEMHYGELLKDDMLDVAGFAWPNPVNGVYPKTDGIPNHVWVVWKNPKYMAYDNYPDTADGDYIKVLAPDYDMVDYGYRIFISAEKSAEEMEAEVTVFQTLLKFGLLSFFVKWWESFFKPKEEPQPLPPPPAEEPPRSALLDTIAASIGKDVAPQEDELACAEAVSRILNNTFHDFPVTLSTTTLYKQLKNHPRFKATLDLTPGNIIISPTGYAKKATIPHGHAGFLYFNNKIVSNDSKTGLFKENYSIEQWVKRYREEGGYPIFVFERV